MCSLLLLKCYFVAVVANVTSRRQVFSIALPGLTANPNAITC